MSDHRIRAARSSDAAAIVAIYNQGIAERSSTFETRSRTIDEIATRIAGRHPLLVAVDADDTVLGWAGLGDYRLRECYAGIAEFSIYLDRAARGRGIGRALLSSLIDAARDRGCWKLVSRVFPSNTASRALCSACGFREVGLYEKHACLDGRWLDVVIVERLIAENLSPGTTASAAAPSSH